MQIVDTISEISAKTMGYFYGLVFFISILALSRTKSINVPSINAVMKSIENEIWEEHEKPCSRKMLDIMYNVQNSTLWATWIWDSMQLPSGLLYGSQFTFGNYDQCIKTPWLEERPDLLTQYCVVDVKLTRTSPQRRTVTAQDSLESYLNTISKCGRRLNSISLAVCLPAICNFSSIIKMARILHQQSYLGHLDYKFHINHCYVNERRQMDFTVWMFVLLVITLMLLAIYSSLTVNKKSRKSGFNLRILQAFSIQKNWADLIKESDIPTINGIRFITSCIIVYIHTLVFQLMGPINNGMDIAFASNSISCLLTKHIDIVVDTFFALSGLFYIKSLMSGRQKNSFLCILKRYIRLVGPLMVVIFYITAISVNVGDGPLWNKFVVQEKDICDKYWWRYLLMMGCETKYTCFVIAWYIPCDFQLSILCTIIFYIYEKHKRTGKYVFGICFVASLLIPGLLTYIHKLKILIMGDIYKLANYRTSENYDYVYTKSYSRAGPYLVGVFTGYILTKYNPAKYTGAVSKSKSIFGLIFALLCMACSMSIGIYFKDRQYDALEAALTVAFNRTVWSAGVCIIIGLCEYGNISLIKDFLSLSVFSPLSRLTYGMYLIHSLVIQNKFFTARTPFYYNKYCLIVDFFGILVLTTILSLVLYLLVEAPLVNMTNKLLSTRYASEYNRNNSTDGTSTISTTENGTDDDLRSGEDTVLGSQCEEKKSI